MPGNVPAARFRAQASKQTARACYPSCASNADRGCTLARVSLVLRKALCARNTPESPKPCCKPRMERVMPYFHITMRAYRPPKGPYCPVRAGASHACREERAGSNPPTGKTSKNPCACRVKSAGPFPPTGRAPRRRCPCRVKRAGPISPTGKTSRRHCACQVEHAGPAPPSKNAEMRTCLPSKTRTAAC